MDDGILLIDKPSGWTSFDVVAKVRGVVRASYKARGEVPTKRQLKVGHAGTLDPFATGLLVVLLAENTKRAGEFLKLDKTYEATFRLGETSETDDVEGDKTIVSGRVPDISEVEQVLGEFKGDIMQLPPQFSALKIDGIRAYKLARDGKQVELKPRNVRVDDIELLDYSYPLVKIRASVGSGTYIRSIARDVGAKLGVGAYCDSLRRLSIDKWSVDDAIAVTDIERCI